MSQLKTMKCPNCNAQLIGQNGKYFCDYCNSIIELDNADRVIRIEKVIKADITKTNIIRDEAKIMEAENERQRLHDRRQREKRNDEPWWAVLLLCIVIVGAFVAIFYILDR